MDRKGVYWSVAKAQESKESWVKERNHKGGLNGISACKCGLMVNIRPKEAEGG